MPKIQPTFQRQNGFLPTFCWNCGQFGAAGEAVYGRKARKKWVFAQFYFKSGQPETVAAQDFAGSLPTFPLFSLSKREKNNIKLYISDEKKWVFGQREKNSIK